MATSLNGEAIAAEPQTEVHPGPTPFFGRAIPLRLGWVVVALLLALECALFVQFFHRELAWAYPTNSDQAVYLNKTYETFNSIVTDGLLPGLLHGLRIAVPTGIMMDLQSALLMLITGPNRVGAIFINFIYFALLQCVVVYTLLWLTKRWSVAFLGLGLLLATICRFQSAGGMADFRLDHIAFCLFGIFVCVAIRSEVFASWRWSLVAGLAGAMLVLFRFQSAVTLGASLLVLLLIFAFKAWRGANPQVRESALGRVWGLLSAGVLMLILIVPGIWPGRRALWHYYFDQVATDVNIRAQEFGAPDRFSYWTFYVHSLTFTHLGKYFFALALGILLMLFAAARLRPRLKTSTAPDQRAQAMWLLLAVLLSIPLAVLTFWPVRNPIVSNILVSPTVALVMGAVVAFAGLTESDFSPPPSPILAVLATLALGCGVLVDVAMNARTMGLVAERESVENVLQFCEEIAERSRQMAWMAPRYAADRVEDYLVPEVTAVLSYERHGLVLHPQTLLGNSITPVSLASAVQAVKEADFAVISSSPGPESALVYPFNVDMERKEDELRATAAKFLVPLHEYRAYGHAFTLYMKPSAKVSGASGGWITANGLTLESTAEMLQTRPNIELSGSTILAEHLGNLSVKAAVFSGGKELHEAPAKLDLIAVPGQVTSYKAVISVSPNQLPARGDVQIRLSFDKYFVPKEIGLNSDTRHLVIMTPKSVSLMP